MKSIFQFLVLILLINSCNSTNSSPEFSKLSDHGFRISEIEFGDKQMKKALLHTGISSPQRYKVEFNSSNSKFDFWLEIWKDHKVEIIGITRMGDYAEYGADPLGNVSFEFDISVNDPSFNDIKEKSLNVICRGSKRVIPLSNESNKGSPFRQTRNFKMEHEKFISNNEFSFIHSQYGECGLMNGEYLGGDSFPLSKLGNGSYIVMKVLYTDSFKEYENYLRKNYERFRPNAWMEYLDSLD